MNTSNTRVAELSNNLLGGRSLSNETECQATGHAHGAYSQKDDCGPSVFCMVVDLVRQCERSLGRWRRTKLT